MYLSRKIADFVVSTAYEQLPETVVRRSKECIVDCLGVTLGGVSILAKQAAAYLDVAGSSGDCTVFGMSRKASPMAAAFINGMVGHVLDFDDSTPVFTGHATVATLAAILALAEKEKRSGRDVILAFATGIEVQWRLGYALATHGDHYKKGWHSTGTIGALGAAAAVAKILRLDAAQTANAIGIAASDCGGFQAQFGTLCKSFHAGRANESGVRAGLLAQQGFTSAPDALESPVGLFALISDRRSPEYLDTFAEPWGLTETVTAKAMNLKMSPVCGGGIGTIENVQYLIKKHGIRHEDVEEVNCLVQPKELDLVPYNDPVDSLQAKFSMHFWVAMTLLEGKVGLAQLTPEKVNDPRIKALTSKVRLIPDPSIPAPPAQMRIEIVLKDGSRHKTEYQARRGTPSNPMTPQELQEKFRECVALTSFDMQTALEVHRMGLALEEVGDFSSMARLLR